MTFDFFMYVIAVRYVWWEQKVQKILRTFAQMSQLKPPSDIRLLVSKGYA